MKRRPSTTRRHLFLCALAGVTGGFAGCLHRGDDTQDETNPTAIQSPQNETLGATPTPPGEGTPEGTPTQSAEGVEIVETTVSEPSVGWNSEISVTVQIRNHGSQARGIWLGLSVRDVTGGVWDQNATTHQRVQIPPTDRVTTSISWGVERAAVPGVYDAIVALWDRATDTTLEDRLDRQLIESAFVLTEARPNTCRIRGDYLYVWADAEDIVTAESAVEPFFSELDCLGISHIFLSWGALPAEIQDPENPRLTEFIAQCRDADIRVSVLWGVELGLAGIEVFREDWTQIRAHDVSSIHVDLEPGTDAESQLDEFLRGYADVLTEVPTDDIDISVFVAPFWVANEQSAALSVRDHTAVDWTVIAAYRTTEAACRAELQTALLDDPVHPYAAAFEFQNPSDPAVDDSITFWGEGASHTMEVLSSIANDPPVEQKFRGVALHEYDAVTDEHYQDYN